MRVRLVGGASRHSDVVRVATRRKPRVDDVRKFGAVGDGKTLNTSAIRRAIDHCTPGGVVRVPAGVFQSGAIFLKSDMTLHLEAGVVLLGSADPKDYPVRRYRFGGKEKSCYASLINTPMRRADDGATSPSPSP